MMPPPPPLPKALIDALKQNATLWAAFEALKGLPPQEHFAKLKDLLKDYPDHLGLQTFKANSLVDSKLVKTSQTGLVYGAGVGVRLLVFTAGVRFRLGTFSEWQLWTLNAEGGLRIPLGSLEPYFTVGAGYASLGSFSTSAPASSKADVKGFNARLGAGLDYYLSNTFSVGANFTGDVLFLSRSAQASASGDEAAVYGKDGSSIGAGATLTAVAGLHF